MSDVKEPRVIKRYANRKLYDMSESSYITHDEIAVLVKNGEEIRIIDNKTKEDLTALTLTQILFKEEKKQQRTLPLHTLRGILQSGGDFIQKRITQPVTSLRDEAEETVRNLGSVKLRFRGGNEDNSFSYTQLEEALQEVNVDGNGDREDHELKAKPAEALRDWLENTQGSFESLQIALEERWDLIRNSLTHLNANRQRIADLEDRVAQLETLLNAQGQDPS